MMNRSPFLLLKTGELQNGFISVSLPNMVHHKPDGTAVPVDKRMDSDQTVVRLRGKCNRVNSSLFTRDPISPFGH
jgi:hypothetical protein